MKNLIGLLLVAGIVVLSACVTINVYFPAAAAEKAADKFIDEVWQLKGEQASPQTNVPKEPK